MNTLHDPTVHIPEAPTIDGLTFRRYQDETDIQHIVALWNGIKHVDRLDITPTVEEFINAYSHATSFEPCRDVLLIEQQDNVIGYAWVQHMEEPDGTQRYLHGAILLPDWRRKGIGRALLRHNERHAAVLAEHHSVRGTRFLEAWAADTRVGAEILLRQEEYVPTRHFLRMRRDLAEPIPDVPLPPGFEIRPALPEHYRRIWDASEDAMADHWGVVRGTDEDFARFMGSPLCDPSRWQVAWHGNEVAGSVLAYVDAAENAEYGRYRGYTENISVRRPWRKQGLASALITCSLRTFQAMGMTEAGLAVDAENLTSALRLYERHGYRATKRSTLYRKLMPT